MKSLLTSELGFVSFFGLACFTLLCMGTLLIKGHFPWFTTYPIVATFSCFASSVLFCWFIWSAFIAQPDQNSYAIGEFKLIRTPLADGRFRLEGSNLFIANHLPGIKRPDVYSALGQIKPDTELDYNEKEMAMITEILYKYNEDQEWRALIHSKGDFFVIARRNLPEDHSPAIFYDATGGRGLTLEEAATKVATDSLKGTAGAFGKVSEAFAGISKAMQTLHSVHEIFQQPTVTGVSPHGEPVVVNTDSFPCDPTKPGPNSVEFVDGPGHTFGNEDFNAGRRKGYADGKARGYTLGMKEGIRLATAAVVQEWEGKVKEANERVQKAYDDGKKVSNLRVQRTSSESFRVGVIHGRHVSILELAEQCKGKPDYVLLQKVQAMIKELQDEGYNLDSLNKIIEKYSRVPNEENKDTGVTEVPPAETGQATKSL